MHHLDGDLTSMSETPSARKTIIEGSRSAPAAIATDEIGLAARTPHASPSLQSIKSFDSTVIQGNLDAEEHHQQQTHSHGTKSKRKGDNKSGDVNEFAMGSVGGHLTLPSPLDVTECPLFCCFYAEFDIKVGPKVCFQSPKEFMEQDMDLSIGKIHRILEESFESIQKQYSSTGGGGEETAKQDVSNAETLLSDPSESREDGSLSIFDSCSEYIITGHELTGSLLNLSSHQMHILTRPTILEDERYERNSLLFCVGFVLRRAGDPRLFRPILSKWALTLRDLEIETHYLSTEQTRPELQNQLDRMLVSLNSAARECFLQLSPSHILGLRLFHPPRPPPDPVEDHTVPVLLRRDWQFQMYDWDLAINWVICHIDGVTTARQICKISEVDMEIVRACLRVLKHHGFVALIDMFFFTNRYETVSSVTHALLQTENKLLTEAVAFCLRGQSNPSGSQENSPSFHGVGSPTDSSNRSLLGTSLRMALAASATSTASDMIVQRVQRREDYLKVRTALAELYNACSRAENIGELWLSILAGEKLQHVTHLDWQKMFSLIDHRRFATFGVVHGLLRRVHNFPMYRAGSSAVGRPPPVGLPLGSPSHEPQCPAPPPIPSFFGPDRFVRYNSADSRGDRSPMLIVPQVAAMMDGIHCDDALACEFGKPLDELIELVGKDKVVSLYATPREARRK